MLTVRMCLRSSGREQSVQRHGQGAGWICGRPLSVLAACNLSHFLSLSMPRLGDLGCTAQAQPWVVKTLGRCRFWSERQVLELPPEALDEFREFLNDLDEPIVKEEQAHNSSA